MPWSTNSALFDRIGINTFEVLEAAGTKWNFLKFQPGLVGGHCIGIDPYYLTWKSNKLGYHAKVITSGRYVNDSMGFYVGKQTVKRPWRGTSTLEARVLVMGLTFKENVADIRNTKVIDVIRELESFNVNVIWSIRKPARRKCTRNTSRPYGRLRTGRVRRHHRGYQPRRIRGLHRI